MGLLVCFWNTDYYSVWQSSAVICSSVVTPTYNIYMCALQWIAIQHRYIWQVTWHYELFPLELQSRSKLASPKCSELLLAILTGAEPSEAGLFGVCLGLWWFAPACWYHKNIKVWLCSISSERRIRSTWCKELWADRWAGWRLLLHNPCEVLLLRIIWRISIQCSDLVPVQCFELRDCSDDSVGMNIL